MASKRKLWATQFHLIGTPKQRHESKAEAYRSVERDGQGWQVYERIDLAELAACERVSDG